MCMLDALGGGVGPSTGSTGAAGQTKTTPPGGRYGAGEGEFIDNRLTSSPDCLLSMSMARMYIVETKLRGIAPSSVGAYPCLPRLSLDERQLAGREAGNTGSTDVRR